MSLIVLPSNGPSGYNLTKSLRFRSSASAYLNRTISSNGSATTWTYSTWVKRGTLGTAQDCFLEARVDGNNNTESRFSSDDTIELLSYNGGAGVYSLKTSQLFRDPSAWYHIVIAVDTTQATSSNRVKLYVNGTQVTAFSTATYPNQNASTYISQTSATHNIGRWPSPTQYFDGYMAEVNFIDGSQQAVTAFGSFNSLTGVWQPAKYTGTYGTNGFYLPFTNITSTTTLGYDFSGNGNNWTTNNISLTTGSTYDSMTDVPTLTSATVANYPTFNAINSNATLSRANLQSLSPSTNWLDAISTMAFPIGTGKWYLEATNSSNSYECLLGVTNTTITAGNTDNYRCAYSSGGLVVRAGYGQGDTTGLSTYTVNDVIGMAVDCSAGTVSFYKNNTLINTTTATDFTTKQLIAFTRQNNAGFNINFGQQGFTYTPPTGFVALNTYNLPTSTIVKGNTVMDATTYTGNATTNNITSLGFQPDLSWFKCRSESGNNIAHDVLRGTGGVNRLYPNLTNAESTNGDGFVTLTSTGFNLDGGGGGGDVNGMTGGVGRTYVAWSWNAGSGSSSSNTSGSITSTVSVNASAGFSVVTFTQTSGNQTVGHGLGVAPSMILQKRRNGTGGWLVYHSSLSSPNTSFLELNTTSAVQSASPFWGTVGSSTFGTSDNTCIASGTYVAYCWAQIAGFSSFGSYTGNGSTDGTFIYTGFRPRFLMVKRTDAGGYGWIMLDTARNPYNVSGNYLTANTADAENNLGGPDSIDFLSNGWKNRYGSYINDSGGTYIYMAFAENPFKNALAR